MRRARLYLLTLAIGCGNVRGSNAPADAVSVDSAPMPDAVTPGDGPILDAASTQCDPKAGFNPPVAILGLELAGLSEISPRLSQDELTMYFWGAIAGGDTNIYVASRSSLEEPFDSPTLLAAANSSFSDNDPSVSADGLSLWFTSNREGEGFHLYVATRSSTLAEFGVPGIVSNVNSTDVNRSDIQPFLTADGSELWFASNRPPSMGNDIWHATRSSSGFTVPVAETSLASSLEDVVPTLSADRLTIYFSSTRVSTTASFSSS